MIIVFDTCTRPEYRRDVHRVLALPKGAVIRYEYKRYLLTEDAASVLEHFSIGNTTLPTLLLYGQRRTYRRGDPDEGLPMLTWADSLFVPTRSAEIVNVMINRSGNREDHVFHFHLKMHGFVDPSIPELETLIKALEGANSLPFGQVGSQHRWISTVPPSANLPIDEFAFISESDNIWPNVVNAISSPDSQFNGDIFWRVLSVEQRSVTDNVVLKQADRQNNRFGSVEWFRDFLVYQQSSYQIRYQTYDSSAHGKPIPGNAMLALIPDDSNSLVMVPTKGPVIRPNQIDLASFSIDLTGKLEDQFAAIELETLIPTWDEPNYDPGSRCELTFRITRSKGRIIQAAILALIAVAAVAVGAIKPEEDGLRKVLCALLAVVCAAYAYYVWKGKVKD